MHDRATIKVVIRKSEAEVLSIRLEMMVSKSETGRKNKTPRSIFSRKIFGKLKALKRKTQKFWASIDHWGKRKRTPSEEMMHKTPKVLRKTISSFHTGFKAW